MSSETLSGKKAKKPKNKGGAPYKQIDWEQVEQMIIQGCNGTQVAAIIGIHPDTLYLRCEAEKKMGFSAYYQEKRAKGDSYLHQAQYQKALKEKNPTLLIWLGKQRLGQKETEEVKQGTPEQKESHDSLLAQIKTLQESLERSIAEKSNNTDNKS